jgi:small subunit ribosomal protein S29
MIMLQAMSVAWQKGWVVVYIPRATELINSTSPYAYNSETQTFHQPALSAAMLSSILGANRKVLSSLKLEKEYETASGQKFSSEEKLDTLMARAVKDETISVDVLEIVMEVLAIQSS